MANDELEKKIEIAEDSLKAKEAEYENAWNENKNLNILRELKDEINHLKHILQSLTALRDSQ